MITRPAKTIMTCAITGAVTDPTATPYLPITTEQIAKAADLIAEALGHSPVWTQIPGMPGSTKTRRPDISTLRGIMPGYQPRPFADGIKQILRG